MRRLLAWLATVAIGILVLALSALFAVMQSPEERHFPEDRTRGLAHPVPHDIETHIDCNRCHLPEKIFPYPSDHTGFPEDGCTECHRPP